MLALLESSKWMPWRALSCRTLYWKVTVSQLTSHHRPGALLLYTTLFCTVRLRAPTNLAPPLSQEPSNHSVLFPASVLLLINSFWPWALTPVCPLS